MVSYHKSNSPVFPFQWYLDSIDPDYFSPTIWICKGLFLSLFIYFRSYDLSFIHPWRFNWRKLCMSYEMNSLFADDILRYMVMEILSGFNSFWIFFYLMYLIYYPPPSPSNTMNNKDFFFNSFDVYLVCIAKYLLKWYFQKSVKLFSLSFLLSFVHKNNSSVYSIGIYEFYSM